jgi:hypothetical protein
VEAEEEAEAEEVIVLMQHLLEVVEVVVLVFLLEVVEVLVVDNLAMGEVDLEELLELKLVEELEEVEDLVVMPPQELVEMVVMRPIHQQQVIMGVVLDLMVMLSLFLTMVQELQLLIMELILEFMAVLYIIQHQHNSNK